MVAPSIPAFPVQSTNTAPEGKITCLVQGPPKTGKTHFAASFPRPLFIYFDPNLATIQKFPDIQFIRPKDYAELATKILPAVQNRLLDCDTIVLDSASFLSDMLVKHEKGSRAKLDFGGWGLVLDRMTHTVSVLMDAALPLPNKPDARSYNIVVTVHERTDTDEDGRIQSVTPSIQGQFRNNVARFFNTVFISKYITTIETPPAVPGTPPTAKRVNKCQLHTVPPDNWRACGDGVGGGKYKTLPPIIDNTYEALMAAWGRK